MNYLSSSLSYAGCFAWAHIIAQSRTAVLSHLQAIQIGAITIIDADGYVVTCGNARADKNGCADSNEGKSVYDIAYAELKIHHPIFWLRAALFADMGFAESYMLGEIDCSDLTAFFKVFIVNRKYLQTGTNWTSVISAKFGAFMRKTNNLANARLHIAAHYDISNDMFAAFLSPDMTYSCPIFLPRSHSTAETLEQAQYRKLAHIISNARIRSSDHVLEIGTGWGSFAIFAVEKTGCRVTSITLSAEQKTLAEQRIKAAGYSDKIEVLLCDYRSLPIPADEQDKYDKIVSIEMLEAVGAQYLPTYFQCVDNLLKTEGGIAVFQSSVIPESRYEAYAKSDDFIRRYIFPGGHLPTKTQLLEAVRSGSAQGHPPRLIPESVEDIGPHYAKTLRLWREKFLANFDGVIKPALLSKHKQDAMSEEDVELFKRKWEYYYSYCEAGFLTKTLGVAIMTVGREGTLQMMDDVQL